MNHIYRTVLSGSWCFCGLCRTLRVLIPPRTHHVVSLSTPPFLAAEIIIPTGGPGPRAQRAAVREGHLSQVFMGTYFSKQTRVQPNVGEFPNTWEFATENPTFSCCLSRHRMTRNSCSHGSSLVRRSRNLNFHTVFTALGAGSGEIPEIFLGN